jgi:2-C-methyl-D-erythritol 4-phosphate cytidylyltransferase
VTSDVTDDAAQVEALGEPVYAVAGDPRNIKVTTPADLELVRALLSGR